MEGGAQDNGEVLRNEGDVQGSVSVQKLRVLAKNSEKSVMNERELISFLRHPFLVNIAYAFQDRENLYLIMDLMPGGDLRFHLCNVESMS